MNEFQFGAILAGRYRVDALLGHGGMADVYRAFDLQRRVLVALKLLKPDFSEDTTFVAKFRREARNLQRLSHPNIVRFYDFVDQGAVAFIVLDCIEGQTLRKILRQRGQPFSPGEVLGYLRPICSALSYAHSQHVVHCDMKLANVMIDGLARVFVNDFGISRLSESATMTFSTPGTAAYMAPEQWRGGDEVFPSTDVYALGVMLYEMLTGRLPFTGDTLASQGQTREKIMREHLSRTPPIPSQVNPALPRVFDEILLRCLEKEPSVRFQSVIDLLDAFETACRRANVVEVPVLAASPEVTRRRAPEPDMDARDAAGGLYSPPDPAPVNKGLLIAGAGGAGLLVVGGGLVLAVLVVVVLALGNSGNKGGSATPVPVAFITQQVIQVVITATPGDLGPVTHAAQPHTVTAQPTSTPAPATPTFPAATVAATLTIAASIPTSSGSVVAYSVSQGSLQQIIMISPNGNERHVLPNQPPNAAVPNFSRVGSLVSYTAWLGGARQVMTMKLDGTDRRQVTSISENYDAAWSPDGQWLAFASTRDSNPEIYVLKLTDLSVRRLTNTPEEEDDPTWSFDGQKIAFERNLGQRWDIFVVDIGSGNSQQLTSDSDSNNTPAWSPDGQSIAFERKVNGRWSIARMRTDGSQIQILAASGTINYRPAWSPDSQQIAWRSNRSGTQEIWIMNADGSEPHQLTYENGAYDPAWGN